MRRIIVALLLVLSATAAATVFESTDNSERQAAQHAAVRIGQPFAIPGDPRLASPDTMYAALVTAASDARVNVLRTSVGYTSSGRIQVSQFVLLTTSTRLYDAFALRDGRWLESADTAKTGHFLSTEPTASADQVGTLADFADNDLILIRPLRAAFDSLPVAATYVVEAPSQSAFDHFLTSLAQAASAGGAGFTVEDFESRATSFPGYATSVGPVLGATQALIVFFIALFLAFQVLHDAKKAGVMKLNGHGAIDVWFALAGRIIVGTLAVSLVIALPASRLVAAASPAFTLDVAVAMARAYAVMLVVSLGAAAYVARANIATSIKNRKDTRGVFVLNTLVKMGCSVLLIAVSAGLVLQYQAATNERAKLGNWERAHGYGIFYPSNVGNDLIELQTSGLATTDAEVHDLYPVLNKQGALYVDAIAYEPRAQAEPLPPGAVRSISVNVNYLRQFPLKDESGATIVVRDETTDWVVLAPARLKADEQRIRELFELRRSGSNGQQGAIQAEEALFDRSAPPELMHQTVAIVWMQDNQPVFTFDPFVNPDSGNTVMDPLVEVMTSANSVGIDRLNMLTGDGGTALKIPLSGGDTVKTLEDLVPTLARLRLDDNLQHLVTMDEYALAQVAALDAGLRSILITGGALLLAFVILTLQSVLILFERYARRVTIRRLFGSGFLRTYREPAVIVASIWSVQVVGALVANRLGLSPFSTSTSVVVADDAIVIAIAAVVGIVEASFSVAVLRIVERQGLVRVLKQEF